MDEKSLNIEMVGNSLDITAALIEIIRNFHKNMEEKAGKEWADKLIDSIAGYINDQSEEKEKEVANRLEAILIYNHMKGKYKK